MAIELALHRPACAATLVGAVLGAVSSFGSANSAENSVALLSNLSSQGIHRTVGTEKGRAASPDVICSLLEREATSNGLPPAFLARLIRQESGFNPMALSSKGAQGIAQFMPGTAAERGLADPFDPFQAIPHSARYLKELHIAFGNLGLAAAAYNAGPNRVLRWLAGQNRLPVETQDYVASITGHTAEGWKANTALEYVSTADEGRSFQSVCQKMASAMSKRRTLSDRHQHRVVHKRAKFPPLKACESGRLCKVGW